MSISNPYPLLRAFRRLLVVAVGAFALLVWGTWPFGRDVWYCAHDLDLEAGMRPPTPITATDASGRQRVYASDEWVPYKELPPNLLRLLVLSEDERFESRNGALDWRAIARAVIKRNGGASTLWSETARSAYDLPGGSFTRSWKRKILETITAVRLHRAISRERLLEVYCNRVDWAGSIGIRKACWTNFSKNVHDLTDNEALWLVGTLPNPNHAREPDRMRQVMSKMLKKLQRAGLEPSDVTFGAQPPVQLRAGGVKPGELPEGVRSEIRRALPKSWLDEARRLDHPDLALTLDFNLQAKIQDDLTRSVEQLAQQLHEPALEGAVVVLNATTGEILACVGSRQPQRQYSCATEAGRPVGSNWKIPIFLAALEQRVVKPDEVLQDAPIDPDLVAGIPRGHPYPSNASGQYRGALTLNDAIAYSSNPIAILLGERCRPELHSILTRTGLGAVRPGTPAQFLGSENAILVRLAAFYAVVVNDGVWNPPHIVAALRQRNGEVRERWTGAPVQLVRPDVAREAYRAMRSAITYGTAQQMRDLPGAAKTGTSSADNAGHPGDLRVTYVEKRERGSFVISIWFGAEKGGLEKDASSKTILGLSQNMIRDVRASRIIAAIARNPPPATVVASASSSH